MTTKSLATFLLLAAAAWAQAQPSRYEAVLKNLKFREIGPANMGGRIDDFAAVESNPSIVFAGTASGGVWKTTNAGVTWQPVFDNEAVSTIGDIAIAPSDPSIVWVGTGESNNRQSSSWGNGVYKSTDGGKSWTHVGLNETHHIGRIEIHPTDPNIVYVAAAGRLWGPNKERGVYKTTDGGKTWSHVLFVNEDTGVNDIAMDPQSPGTLYAGAYQRRRSAFGFNGSGPHGALYKTTDAGATWTKLTKGLPEGGETGRIGVHIYRKNPAIVYAIIEHARGGIFRSEDRGESWTRMSDTNSRPMYYSQIRIDPNNDQRIWSLAASMYFSDDGGRTFRTNLVTRIHGDHHAMWINPANSDHMIVGSDGGIHWSYDRGRTWDYVNTLPLAQFYEIGVDMKRPYSVCGGLQDNGSWCGPSATLYSQGITNEDWWRVGGGDGFYVQIDPTDPNTVYAESQDGNLLRRDLRTFESRSIRPEPKEGEARYRFQWNSPVVISSHNNRTIYYGGNFLFKSSDRGDSWNRLGPDLTTGVDRNKLSIMGKVPDRDTLSRHDGVQAFPTITTVSESPISASVLWVGTDDGNLQVTRNGGETWKNVAERLPGVPKGTYISRVVASRHEAGAAYATLDGHRNNDFNIYVFRTGDYGESWQRITNGMPQDNGVINVVREHHRNANLLFAGGEYGFFVSLDRGANWQKVKANLPTVPVDDIAVHPRENDLILGTHGRSVWILDDLAPLEQLSEKVISSDLHAFDVRPATAWRLYGSKGATGHKLFTAQNPPFGAMVYYYLKAKLSDKERVRITILDKDKKRVRQMDGPKEAGLNRAVWDLRQDPAAEPTAEQRALIEQFAAGGGGGGGGGFFGGGGRGPMVEPGDYTVEIAVGANQVTKPFKVEEDPRITISAADRAVRRKAITELYELSKTANRGQRTISAMRTQLGTTLESWRRPGGPAVPDNVRKAAEALSKQVNDLASKLVGGGGPGGGGFGGGGGRGGFGGGVFRVGGGASGVVPVAGPAEQTPLQLGSAGPPLVYTPPALPQRIGRLTGAIEGYTAAPTPQQSEEITVLTKLLGEAMGEVQKLEAELPKLNKMMNDAGVPHIRPEAPAAPPQFRRRGD